MSYYRHGLEVEVLIGKVFDVALGELLMDLT